MKNFINYSLATLFLLTIAVFVIHGITLAISNL